MPELNFLPRLKNSECPQDRIGNGCAYIISKKDGSEQVTFTQFYQSLLEAKGLTLSSGGSAGIGKGGRKLSYKAVLQVNGNLLIGKANTAMLCLEPGAEFDIKLGKRPSVWSLSVGLKRKSESRTQLKCRHS